MGLVLVVGDHQSAVEPEQVVRQALVVPPVLKLVTRLVDGGLATVLVDGDSGAVRDLDVPVVAREARPDVAPRVLPAGVYGGVPGLVCKDPLDLGVGEGGQDF